MSLEKYLQEHYSATARGNYIQLIERFTSFMQDKAIRATYQEVVEYISYLRGEGLHPKTVRNHLYAIIIYYRYLQKSKQRRDHPCQHLYLKDQINRAIAVETLYTPQQLESLLQNYQYRALKNHSPKKQMIEARNKIIIGLLIYQALTVLELKQLNTENVNLERGTIFIKANVKNQERLLSLKPHQIMPLHRYLTEVRPQLVGTVAPGVPATVAPMQPQDHVLIPNYRGERLDTGSVLKQINHGREKKDWLRPLKIRQSVIAHRLKAGHDLRLVQVFAGHRNASSTEAYRQTGLEELKTFIDQLHPLQ